MFHPNKLYLGQHRLSLCSELSSHQPVYFLYLSLLLHIYSHRTYTYILLIIYRLLYIGFIYYCVCIYIYVYIILYYIILYYIMLYHIMLCYFILSYIYIYVHKCETHTSVFYVHVSHGIVYMNGAVRRIARSKTRVAREQSGAGIGPTKWFWDVVNQSVYLRHSIYNIYNIYI